MRGLHRGWFKKIIPKRNFRISWRIAWLGDWRQRKVLFTLPRLHDWTYVWRPWPRQEKWQVLYQRRAMQTTCRLHMERAGMQLKMLERCKNLAYGFAFDWSDLWAQMVVDPVPVDVQAPKTFGWSLARTDFWSQNARSWQKRTAVSQTDQPQKSTESYFQFGPLLFSMLSGTPVVMWHDVATLVSCFQFTSLVPANAATSGLTIIEDRWCKKKSSLHLLENCLQQQWQCPFCVL